VGGQSPLLFHRKKEVGALLLSFASPFLASERDGEGGKAGGERVGEQAVVAKSKDSPSACSKPQKAKIANSTPPSLHQIRERKRVKQTEEERKGKRNGAAAAPKEGILRRGQTSVRGGKGDPSLT